MTLFDLIATIIILLSVLAGFSNGAIREVVGLFSFALAAVASVLLLPVSGPLARGLIQPSWAASAAAVVVSFLVLYIGLQLAGRFLTRRLRDSGGLGTLDRLAGAAIGLVRAAVVLGVLYLAYNASTPVEIRPPWIERAALFPLARASGQLVQRVTPKGMAAAVRLGPSLKNAVSNPDPDAGIQVGGDSGADDRGPHRGAQPAHKSGVHRKSASGERGESSRREAIERRDAEQRERHGRHPGLNVELDKTR